MNDVEAFRALHRRDFALVLPNVWDAATTVIARDAGAEAIATTSAGIAWACGYPDGEALPHGERINAVRAVIRSARPLPVSVDLEAGYADDPELVAAAACELRSLGVVGLNIEDAAADAGVLERKIAAVKRALAACHDDIFVNARTDIYLYASLDGAAALREVQERGRRYEAAGADGFFVPMVVDAALIAAIARSTSLPLNVLATRGLPARQDLERVGVRRVSAGGRLAELAYGTARSAMRSFVEAADASVLFSAHSLTHAQMDALFDDARHATA